MRIPERFPGLTAATLLLAAYGVVWIALEGSLGRVLLLAAGIATLSLLHGSRRLWGRTLSRRAWLGFAGLFGLSLGMGSGLLALVLMALKTGLHAHGPEFRPAEISWVVMQLPWWAAGGLGAGLGLGLVLLALWGEES